MTASIEGRLYRIEVAGLLCWLLKDAAWVLVVPGVALPAAVLAMFIEVYIVSVRWKDDKPIQRAHNTAALLWLLGNASWLSGELLHDKATEGPRHFPWHLDPVLGSNERLYKRWIWLARGMFIAALVGLLTTYMGSICAKGQEPESYYPASMMEPTPRVQPALVFGIFTAEAYEGAFIGPWIVKDLCWTFQLCWVALPFGLLVVVLIIDYIYIARTDVVFHFIELWWVVANVVALTAELVLRDEYMWPRITAGVMLLFATAVACAALCQAIPGKRRTQEAPPSEGSYLFGGQASARAVRSYRGFMA
mmetsp:Transcript_673/g.1626  ORF Transcript_673/g.1626 Transcript_673/m.1626 type:complete len:306 (+) Transcript_673:70-987(+)